MTHQTGIVGKFYCGVPNFNTHKLRLSNPEIEDHWSGKLMSMKYTGPSTDSTKEIMQF